MPLLGQAVETSVSEPKADEHQCRAGDRIKTVCVNKTGSGQQLSEFKSCEVMKSKWDAKRGDWQYFCEIRPRSRDLA